MIKYFMDVAIGTVEMLKINLVQEKCVKLMQYRSSHQNCWILNTLWQKYWMITTILLVSTMWFVCSVGVVPGEGLADAGALYQ